MSSISFSGLTSGINTDALITALMEVEKAPINKLNSDVSRFNQASAAWTKLESLTKALADRSLDLSSAAKLYSPTTTSSDPAAVSVTGTAAAGTDFAFTVTSLAKAGQSAVTGLTGADQVIGAGTVTVATAAGSQTITLEAGATVGDLVAAVNKTGLATGSVLNTGDPVLGHEALFTSKGTGTAAEATVTLTGFAGGHTAVTVRSATDATLQVGSQTITRPTNTITDLVPGATVTLRATTAGDVTITSARNDDDVTAKVKGFVDSLNGLLGEVKTFTRNDPATGASGVLAGDGSLRSLNVSLMRAITDSYGDTATSLLSQIGIRVERDGTLSFNEATFKTALRDNPDGVADLLSRSASSASASVAFSSATAGTASGSYDVVITQAASRAEVLVAFSPLPADTDFTVTVGDKTGTFTALAGADGADVASSFASWLKGNGFALTASFEGGDLAVRSTGYGSTQSFTLSSTLGTSTGTGTDVAGTINGAAATGTGRVLTSTAGASTGLSLSVSASAADVAAAAGSLALGSTTFNEGVGGVLSALLNAARDANGVFPSALGSLDRARRDAQEQIETYTRRMEMREENLRAKFSALEVALARLQSNSPDFSALSTDIYSPR